MPRGSQGSRKALREELEDSLEFRVLPIENMAGIDIDSEGNVYAGKWDAAELWRSEDHGLTWTKIFEVAGLNKCRCVFIDSRGYIFTVVDDINRIQDGFLYRSTDGGTSFSSVFNIGTGDVLDHAIDEDVSGNLYIGIHRGSLTNRVYKSTDGGATWTEVLNTQSGVHFPASGDRIQTIGCNPFATTDTVYACWGAGTPVPGVGIARSDDGGANWTQISTTRQIVGMEFSYYSRYFMNEAPSEALWRTPDDTDFQKLFCIRGENRSWILEPFTGNLAGWAVRYGKLGTLYVGFAPFPEAGYPLGWAHGVSSLWGSPDGGETFTLLLSLPERGLEAISKVSPLGFIYITQRQGRLLRIRDIPVARLPAPEFGEDILFDEYELRDTDAHYSDADGDMVSNCRYFDQKIIKVKSTLDQEVDVQIQGSHIRDFSEVWDIGSPLHILAGDVTTRYDYDRFTDHFEYVRVEIQAGTIPTDGDVTVWVSKR